MRQELTPAPDSPKFLSVRAVAESLSLSTRTVRRRISDGTLPHAYVGRRVLVPASALSDLLRDAVEREVNDGR